MKTLELKLKKDVLIVDKNDLKYYSIIDNEIIFKLKDVHLRRIKGNYKFLCKGSELTEEIASELADKSIYTGLYAHYVDKIPVNTYCYNSAIPSFISAVESKSFYWLENPFKDWRSDGEIHDDDLDLIHKEAEEKTFHNPLIFVKKS